MVGDFIWITMALIYLGCWLAVAVVAAAGVGTDVVLVAVDPHISDPPGKIAEADNTMACLVTCYTNQQKNQQSV